MRHAGSYPYRIEVSFADRATAAARERSAAAAKVLVDPDTVPWETAVEFFTGGRHLSIKREDMTLRDAVRRFMVLPIEAQQAAGIGMHEPYLAMVHGRPVAVGFLNYSVIKELAWALNAETGL